MVIAGGATTTAVGDGVIIVLLANVFTVDGVTVFLVLIVVVNKVSVTCLVPLLRVTVVI
jgi:hypothetical protein